MFANIFTETLSNGFANTLSDATSVLEEYSLAYGVAIPAIMVLVLL